MKKEELTEILRIHGLWLSSIDGGRCADLSGANLRYANLSGADLRGANLRGANLRYTVGNSKEIFTVQTNKYTVVYTKDIIQIGCKNYTHDKWMNFTDNEISRMDDNALEWWKEWKPLIFKMIELNFKESK